jgi:hypothetical protein
MSLTQLSFLPAKRFAFPSPQGEWNKNFITMQTPNGVRAKENYCRLIRNIDYK